MVVRILKIVALALFLALVGIKVLSFIGFDILAMVSLTNILTPKRQLFLMIADALLLAVAFVIDFKRS